jgi:hypothetical protein
MSASLRLGTVAGWPLSLLRLGGAVVLGTGVVTLPSPDEPVANPWFTLMEVLILLIAPAMVAFMVGLHAWTSSEHKAEALLFPMAASLLAIVFTRVGDRRVT